MTILEQRYEGMHKKFAAGDIPVGEMVLIKVMTFTEAQMKKDPSLRDSEPPLYVMGVVVKHLKRSTRIHCPQLDFDGFGTPDHVDLASTSQVVWLVESAMRIARAPEIEEDTPSLPAGHCVLRARDNRAGYVVDHVFPRPRHGEQGSYRAITSLNSSSDTFAARTADGEWGDVALSLARVEDMRGWDPANKIVNHADIWSAYRAVGYDYKTRKLDETKVLSGDHE